MHNNGEMKSLLFHKAEFTQEIPGTDLTYQAKLSLTKDEWKELLDILEHIIPLEDYAPIPGEENAEFSYRLFVHSRRGWSVEAYKKRVSGVELVVIDPNSALSTPFDKIHLPVAEAEKLIETMRKYFNQQGV